MIVHTGFDAENNVDLYQCTNCKANYGKLPGSAPIVKCEHCSRVEAQRKLKERIAKAQVAAVTLQRAIINHRLKVEAEFDATEADTELWEILDSIEVPNDSPAGIMGIIPEKEK